jgi:hypothetical protein
MTHSNKVPTNSHNDPNFEKTVNGRPVTESEVAYRNGYVNGRVNENKVLSERERLYETNQTIRDNDNAARGLLLGFLLTALVGIVGGLTFFFTYANNDESEPIEPVAPLVVPNGELDVPPSPVEPQSQGGNDTTIIERTIERTEVLPAPPPESSTAPVPRVEVNTPSPAPPEVEVNVPAPPPSQPSAPQGQNNGRTPQPDALSQPQGSQNPQRSTGTVPENARSSEGVNAPNSETSEPGLRSN